MGEDGKLVNLTFKDQVAWLMLDSPPLNILTCAMMDAVSDAMGKVREDGDVKALVLHANGKAFSAGADVAEHTPDKAPDLISAFSRMFKRFGELEVPVVMGVDGAALGAGLELVMVADILIGTERAKFGQPEIKLGFFAPLGVAWLPAIVGHQKALEMCCTGRTYDAEDMRECGLVTKVVLSEDLPEAIDGYLDDFRKMSAAVLRLNVRMLKKLRFQSFEKARLEAEQVFLEELVPLEDVTEGIASFMEKRRPVWRNR